jgi:hypothetical protein
MLECFRKKDTQQTKTKEKKECDTKTKRVASSLAFT